MKKSSQKRKKRSDIIFFSCLVAFPIAQFCIFYLGVNLNSVLLTFKAYDRNSGSYYWTGFDNFKRIFNILSDETILSDALINSLIVYAAGLLVGVTLSLLFSFYIYKKMPGQRFFKIMLFLPSIIPSVVMVIMFKYFTERALPDFFNQMFHLNMGGLLSDHTFGLLLFYNIWIGFGTGILMYTGAMGNISESIVESCRLEGCPLMHEFFFITLPLIWRTLSTFLIVGIAGLFTNQMNLFTFFGASAEARLWTIGYYLFKDLQGAMSIAEYPRLAAMGVLLTLISVPVTLIVRKLLEKFGPSTD